MKILCGFIFILVLSVCRPGASYAASAQTAAAPAAQHISASTAAVSAAQAPQKQQQKPKAAPAVKKAAPSEEEGEGAVMIDSKSDEDRSGRFSAKADADDTDNVAEETPVPGGLPSSYGQLKGVMNEAGKNLLVFESDDGAITFVQVFVGKNSVSWKLVSKIVRSPD